MIRLSRFTAFATLVSLLAVGAARAQSKTSFNPEFLFAYGYSNNLAGGGGGNGTQQSEFGDNFARLEVRLPLVHRWKTGTMELRFAPRIMRYDTFEELDRVDHFFNFRFTDRTSAKGLLDISVFASASQLQGRAAGDDPAGAFLARRTNRQIYRGQMVYRQGFASTWRWSAAASPRLYRYSDIDDVPPPTPGEDNGSQVEDRDAWLLGFQVDKDVARRTYIGGRYERSNFTLEFSGQADTDALLFTYERKLDRRSELEFTVGGFTTKGTAVVNCEGLDDAECIDGNEASDRTSGLQGDASYTRRFRGFSVRARGVHRPSAGGALFGAVRFSLVQVAIASANAASPWRWSLVPRWALRQPFDDLLSDRQTFSIGALLTRRINEALTLRFRSDFAKQAGDAISDRDVWSSDIGLVWAPWQGTRMAQR